VAQCQIAVDRTPENELRELRAWCKSAGHEVVGEYVDLESGENGAKKRKHFADLFPSPSV
jgi:hypothetical protein